VAASRLSIVGTVLLALFSAIPAAADAELFADRSVLDISLAVNFKKLCHPREDPDCEFTATMLEYQDAAGDSRSLPVEIKVRGGWRSMSSNCSTPLLWVRFSHGDTAGTPFEGQSLLPLTTHCGRGLSLQAQGSRSNNSDWEQLLLKEYLGHRMYEQLTDASIRTRLVRISYSKSEKSRHSINNYAFFSEHFDAMAARNEATRLERGNFDHEKLDTHAADILALFQFMIGNTDWSVPRERNTVLIETLNGTQVPVPYDLDMSGLVNAPYAGPSPGLPIDEVSDRYYLGFCHPDPHWATLFASINDKKQDIMGMREEVPNLKKSSKKWVDRFLRQFFQILETEDLRKKLIENACQPWPPSPIDHTTPLEDR
jgi:hypothetical protein